MKRRTTALTQCFDVKEIMSFFSTCFDNSIVNLGNPESYSFWAFIYTEKGDLTFKIGEKLYDVHLNQSQADVQVYPYSAEVAEREGDLDWYRQSTKLNIACKEAVENAISRHYRNNTLDSVAVQNVVAQFGWPRTAFVLANTVRNKDWDARISHDNKDWAKRIPIYPDVNTFGEDKRLRYVVDSHAGLTDLFITALRREYQQQKDQPGKPSVREKLQPIEKTTSPKISAKKKTPER